MLALVITGASFAVPAQASDGKFDPPEEGTGSEDIGGRGDMAYVKSQYIGIPEEEERYKDTFKVTAVQWLPDTLRAVVRVKWNRGVGLKEDFHTARVLINNDPYFNAKNGDCAPRLFREDTDYLDTGGATQTIDLEFQFNGCAVAFDPKKDWFVMVWQVSGESRDGYYWEPDVFAHYFTANVFSGSGGDFDGFGGSGGSFKPEDAVPGLGGGGGIGPGLPPVTDPPVVTDPPPFVVDPPKFDDDDDGNEIPSECGWNITNFLGSILACLVPTDPLGGLSGLFDKMQGKIPFGVVEWITTPLEDVKKVANEGDRNAGWSFNITVMGHPYTVDLLPKCSGGKCVMNGAEVANPIGELRPWLTPLLVVCIWGSFLLGVMRRSARLF